MATKKKKKKKKKNANLTFSKPFSVVVRKYVHNKCESVGSTNVVLKPVIEICHVHNENWSNKPELVI